MEENWRKSRLKNQTTEALSPALRLPAAKLFIERSETCWKPGTLELQPYDDEGMLMRFTTEPGDPLEEVP